MKPTTRTFTRILQTRSTLRAFVISSSALFLISCAQFPRTFPFVDFSPPITQSVELDPTTAIVYGRFAKESGFASGAELALRLCNQSSKQDYLIRFQDEHGVYGIAVEPGNYKIAGYVATFRDAIKVLRNDYRESPSFEVRPDACTYLGNFTGNARIAGANLGGAGVTASTNNSVSITKEFRQKYPNLASAPVVSPFDKRLR